jgi:hypothetical protein
MSTRANAIDLSGSDDEEETQKKRKPEVTTDLTCGCSLFIKCYLHFNYANGFRVGAATTSTKEADMCGCCDKVKENLKETGNSIGFVCEACEEDNTEMAFCDGCHRYEETDGENLCGRCQSDPKKRTKYDSDSDSDSDDN